MCVDAATAVVSVRDILPTWLRPTHYELTLTPDLQAFSFTGSVVVTLQVNQTTAEIQLNANELEIHSAEVEQGGKKQTTKNWKLKDEVLHLFFEEALVVGVDAQLSVTFTGTLNDQMAGFYRSAYTDAKTGEKRHLACTQFEACDARKCFPCWDEPALKATYGVTLIVPENRVALSNMPAKERVSLGNGKVRVSFPATPVMSTYLLAFVVGEFDHVETVTREGLPLFVYTLPGQKEQGRFALDVASKTMSFFTDYFGVPYVLPSMQIVAIPDFGAGAMENYGLVTFRQVYLLFDPEASSLKAKQRVAYVVAHELAHQWFGNYVTMDWWSALWLNEGFATWVGWLAVNHLFPEWHIWTSFLQDDTQRGLGLDAMRASHPIDVPVRNPSEISQIFDAISYSKGASVIRMLVAYLGENTFKKGISAYLKRHAFGNATTDDLWRALSEASQGKPVKQIMDTWTLQMGYPVLQVKQQQQHWHVRQSRFLSSGDATPADDTQLWQVPLSLLKQDGTVDHQLLLSKKEVSIPAALKLNGGQHGFYRVQYEDAALQQQLEQALSQPGRLSGEDRLGLVADAFALASAGYSSSTVALQLVRYYNVQDGYVLWSEIGQRLSQLLSVWWEEPVVVRQHLDGYVARLTGLLVQELGGFEYQKGESDNTGLLRALVIGLAGRAGHEAVLKEARQRFNDFVAGQVDRLHPNLRGIVFELVQREGGDKVFDQLLDIYRTCQVQDQKLSALSALGASRNVAILQRVLQFALSEEVRLQDIIYPVGAVAANPVGRRLAWQWTQQNWSALYDRYYKGSTALLSRVISSTAADLSTEQDAKDIEAFFNGKEVTAVQRSIQQSLEKVRSSTRWLARDRQAVADWAQKQHA